MEPIPSTLTKTYQPRGPLRQFRFAKRIAFRCFRCGNTKKSKLITLHHENWSQKLCNGCYGRLLSIYEVKAGTAADDDRADQLAKTLFSLINIAQQQEAERVFRTSEERADKISAEARRFIATAEYVAGHLESNPTLEWSPPIIGLCKAVEMEMLHLVIVPLRSMAADENLEKDKMDKDIGRVAAFCAGQRQKPPELGAIAHFLQTVIHSKRRRQTSALVGCFLRLAAEWTGSTWFLTPDGLYRSLTLLTQSFRNRAAHIDELTAAHYRECRELVVGTDGILWKLILSTEPHQK